VSIDCGCEPGACIHWGGLQYVTGAGAERCGKCNYMRCNHWVNEGFGKCPAFIDALQADTTNRPLAQKANDVEG